MTPISTHILGMIYSVHTEQEYVLCLATQLITHGLPPVLGSTGLVWLHMSRIQKSFDSIRRQLINDAGFSVFP